MLFNAQYVETEVTSNAVGPKKSGGPRRGVTGRVRGGTGTRGRGSALTVATGNDSSGVHLNVCVCMYYVCVNFLSAVSNISKGKAYPLRSSTQRL